MPDPARPKQLFADDLPPGFRFRGEGKPLTEERFRAFAAMIRKLSSGQYRLYSRKKNPRTDRKSVV